MIWARLYHMYLPLSQLWLTSAILLLFPKSYADAQQLSRDTKNWPKEWKTISKTIKKEMKNQWPDKKKTK